LGENSSQREVGLRLLASYLGIAAGARLEDPPTS
jgi:hypothetical protein